VSEGKKTHDLRLQRRLHVWKGEPKVSKEVKNAQRQAERGRERQRAAKKGRCSEGLFLAEGGRGCLNERTAQRADSKKGGPKTRMSSLRASLCEVYHFEEWRCSKEAGKKTNSSPQGVLKEESRGCEAPPLWGRRGPERG